MRLTADALRIFQDVDDEKQEEEHSNIVAKFISYLANLRTVMIPGAGETSSVSP